MVASGASSVNVSSYAPLLKVKQKAAEIRAQLQEAGAPSPALKPGALLNKPALSVHVPESASDEPKAPRISTPAKPTFKPNRPFATVQGGSDDPFTPLGPPTRSGLRSQISPDAADGFSARRSMTSCAGEGVEDGQHTTRSSSFTSRPSTSQLKSQQTRVARSGNSRVLRSSLAAQETSSVLAGRIVALETQLAEWQEMHQEVSSELDRRQESYMRREATLQAQLASVQAELATARNARTEAAEARCGPTRQALRQLHDQVACEIESLLRKQEAALRHEESTQARRLKSQLIELEAELGAERGVSGRTNAEWLQRTGALRQELDAVQAIATKLDAMYKLSEEECRRLRAQFKCQEDDRDVLVRQVVGLKKENKRLAVELAALAADAAAAAKERDDALATLKAQPNQRRATSPEPIPEPGMPQATQAAVVPNTAVGGGPPDARIQAKIERYEAVIESLKRLCDAERRRARQARAAHMAELAARTKLHITLRQCLDDVKAGAKAGHDQAAGHVPAIEDEGDRAGLLERADQQGSSSESGPHGVAGGARNFTSAATSSPGTAARPVRPRSAAVRPSNPCLAASQTGHLPRPQSALGFGPSPPAVAPAGAMGAVERRAFLQAVSRQEALLLRLMEAAFPHAAPPSLPGDVDRLVAAREAHDAAIVGQGRALAGRGTRPVSARGPAPTNETIKLAAVSKPWVFNVDTMMSEFLTK